VATAAAPGQLRLREVAGAMARAGIPFEWLSAAEAAERWPGMRFPGPVLHEPSTAGRVDADAAVAALQAAAEAHGAVVRHHRRVESVGRRSPSTPTRRRAGRRASTGWPPRATA
jgi:sarcosine oxidase